MKVGSTKPEGAHGCPARVAAVAHPGTGPGGKVERRTLQLEFGIRMFDFDRGWQHLVVLPPTIKVKHPNPELELESSPFHLATRARPWVRDGSHPRRAAVSAFGFGGSNFHVALSEYKGNLTTIAPRLRSLEAELVTICG